MKICNIITFWYIVVTSLIICWSLPILDSDDGNNNETIDGLQTNVNDTPKNLYVVKAVVYEIGILTEVDDNDTNSFESQERVDLTFFDAHTNESHIDLGNIPLPLQTNVSGQVLTGIVPVNIGAFSSASELLQTLPLTGSIVNITHSDTAFYKLTKSNITDEAKPKIVNMEDIGSISDAAALFPSSIASSQSPNEMTSQESSEV